MEAPSDSLSAHSMVLLLCRVNDKISLQASFFNVYLHSNLLKILV